MQVLFGLHYPLIKPAFSAGLDPGAWAAVRVVCATVLLFLGTARWFACPFPRERRDLWGLAGVALLGVRDQPDLLRGWVEPTPPLAIPH